METLQDIQLGESTRQDIKSSVYVEKKYYSSTLVSIYIVLNAQKNVWKGSEQTGNSGYMRRILGLGLGPLGGIRGDFSFICNVIILLWKLSNI